MPQATCTQSSRSGSVTRHAAAATEPDRVAALIDAHRGALAELRAAARAFEAADSIEAERTGCPELAAADRRLEAAIDREQGARIDLALCQPRTDEGRQARRDYLQACRGSWDSDDLQALLDRLIDGAAHG
jgi:hypothetical protein